MFASYRAGADRRARPAFGRFESIPSDGGSTTARTRRSACVRGSLKRPAPSGSVAPTAATFNINGGGKYIQTIGSVVPGTTKNFAAASNYEWQTGGGATFPSVGGISFGNLIINTTSGNNTASGNLTNIQGNLVIANTGSGVKTVRFMKQ